MSSLKIERSNGCVHLVHLPCPPLYRDRRHDSACFSTTAQLSGRGFQISESHDSSIVIGRTHSSAASGASPTFLAATHRDQHYFESKEALLFEITADGLDRVRDDVILKVRGIRDPEERLRQLVIRHANIPTQGRGARAAGRRSTGPVAGQP